MTLRIGMNANSFFDADRILREHRRRETARLRRAGAFVMTTARQSLKTAKGPSAPAGSPPRSHTKTLKRSVRFDVDSGKKLVRIGPQALGKAAGVAALQAIEFGGWSHTVRRGRRVRKIRVSAHPFMGPALDKETPKLPAIWAN